MTGDPALLGRTRQALGRAGEPFVVTVVDGDTRRIAADGIELAADVEIGSVSKGITGLLLHDSIARGEVSLRSRIGEHLDLGDGPVAEVTLETLATHRSGLPRLAPGSDAVRGTWRLLTRGENPYGESLAVLLDRVRDVRPGRQRHSYSNLGYMLLGHALAAAAGMTYARLVQVRIADPLGLTGVSVPSSPDELGPHAALGRNRRGQEVEAWTGEALGPAGGIRATADDLCRLVGALLDGSAPGVGALDPVESFAGRGVRIGAAWLTLSHQGREITWHNGGTGGFRSFVGLDRAAGRGVAIVRLSPRSADRAGFDLLSRPAHTDAT